MFGIASTTKKSRLHTPPTVKKEKLQLAVLDKTWFDSLPPWVQIDTSRIHYVF